MLQGKFCDTNFLKTLLCQWPTNHRKILYFNCLNVTAAPEVIVLLVYIYLFVFLFAIFFLNNTANDTKLF